MARPYVISAIGTPLDDDEHLHQGGLEAHLEQQRAAGIDGILVAGTMGLLQLLRDTTYEQLVRESSRLWNRPGELLVGIGDASLARTRDRLTFVNQFPVGGVVALAPYFIKFSQQELIAYYRALADESRSPLYLYDLPQRTGTSLEIDTVVQLSRHPHIAGIKCSGDIGQARLLKESLPDTSFRIIVAQPLLIDVLTRAGVQQHLDGIYAVVPGWVQEISDLIEGEQWDATALRVKRLAELLKVFHRYGVFQSMTELLNAMGVPGNFAPRPHAKFDERQRRSFLEEPIIREVFVESATP